jgi:hypothetical protein
LSCLTWYQLSQATCSGTCFPEPDKEKLHTLSNSKYKITNTNLVDRGGERYMDFGSGFRVKEGLDTVPQQPESLPSINYEHAVKCLF